MKALILRTFILWPLMMMATGHADEWSFIKDKKLQAFARQGQWPAAIKQFEVSPERKRKKSAQALYAFFLFQSGNKITALDELMDVQKPQLVPTSLKKLWHQNTKAGDVDVTKIPFAWKKQFTGVLNSELADGLFTQEVLKAKSMAELNSWRNQLPKSPNKDNVRDTWTRWLIVSNAPTFDKPQWGLEQLDQLQKSKQTMLSADTLAMARGRILYQLGRLTDAVQVYKSIPKSSDFWLEALEEMAWAHLRNSQPEKALAQLKTVTSYLFANQIGPEPYVLANLAHVEICDYPGVFKTSAEFKTKFKVRVQNLKTLLLPQGGERINAVIASLQSGFKLSQVKNHLAYLPRFVLNDRVLQRFMNFKLAAQSEIRQFASQQQPELDIHSSPLAKSYVARVEKKISKAHQFMQLRIAQLASQEIQEIKAMTQNMQLIETEVIQRIYMEERVADRKKERDSFEDDSKEKLNFPYTDEVWLDEVGNYNVLVKDCPGLKKAEL